MPTIRAMFPSGQRDRCWPLEVALSGSSSADAIAFRDATTIRHSAAIRELEDALAGGRTATPARSTLQEWLGPLHEQMALMEVAMAQVQADPETFLSRQLALDLAECAQVVSLAAAYDASRSRADADQLALRARALRSRAASGMSGGMEELLDAKKLEDSAANRQTQATDLDALAEQAVNIHQRAMDLAGEDR